MLSKLIADLKNLVGWDMPPRDLEYVYTYSKEQYLAHFTRRVRVSFGASILVIVEEKMMRGVKKKLKGLGCKYKIVTSEQYLSNTKAVPRNEQYTQILVVDGVSQRVNEIVKKLSRSRLEKVETIYKVDVNDYYKTLMEFDKLPRDMKFVDDSLDISEFDKIYRSSLKKFELKCQVKDAMDLFFAMKDTVRVEGDVIEVGSFHGHSGYLIRKFLDHYGCRRKKLYMCDMFDAFPEETLGVDQSWSRTHKVAFEKVKAAFLAIKGVRLVRGDIRETLPKINARWAFAYIDVDSYSATRYALEAIYPRLSKRGIMVCEDYGEPHCIGARIAIDEYIQKHKLMSFFSFFSGCKVIIKI